MYDRPVRTLSALGLSALGSVGGLLVASLFLLIHERGRSRVLPSLISYAVGTLLGAALLAALIWWTVRRGRARARGSSQYQPQS